MQAQFLTTDDTILYTPLADAATGDVIVIGGRVRIASHAIPSGQLGTLSTRGVFSGLAVSGTIDAGTAIYWDEGATVFTSEASGNTFAGYSTTAKASGDARVVFALADVAPSGGDLTAVIADPGDEGEIPVATSGTCEITTAGGELRALGNPTFTGQVLCLVLKEAGGTLDVECASPVDTTHDYLILDAAGDAIVLFAVEVESNRRWRILANCGASLSTRE